MTGRTVVIVGAGLAGSRCAETLRTCGFDGRVVLFGEEPAAPYERPGLSRRHLADTDHHPYLRPARFWHDNAIELRLGQRVEDVNFRRRMAGGLQWDALVLATGARARRLPGEHLARMHTLRPLADAAALRRSLQPGRRLVILGAGFVGSEVASTARSLGVEVTLVDRATTPLLRALGAEVGGILTARMAQQGVDLRLRTGLRRIVKGPGRRIAAVELSDGSRVPCDALLVAIGVQPAGELLGGPNGVDTDSCGRTAVPDVYACGDVARWWRPSLGRPRVEHWTSAAGQATAVAHAILGQDAPYDDLPFFWSDQFGLRLQHVGHAETWNRVELEGDSDSFSVRYLAADGQTVAMLLANRPRDIGAARRELAQAHVQRAA
jgi:NADPH-dependent 2,4-dienoyl-CoA reductase/sulfur reductase-like enzyme